MQGMNQSIRIGIVGAGAVGSWLAARLALAGAAVTLVARGAQHEAIATRGLRLRDGSGERVARPRLAATMAEAGAQDYVFLTVKAYSLASVAREIAPMLNTDTAVVPALNGVPWWFFEGFGGPLTGARLATLDPSGEIASHIDIRRIIGCVVYPGVVVPEPGVVQHSVGERVVIGEPSGATSSRAAALAGMMCAAGFDTPVSDDIRREIWFKLWGNMNVNPSSLITGTTIGALTQDAYVRDFLLATMAEAEAVSSALGIRIPMSRDERMAITEKLVNVKTSMLQDLERGKPIELDAILGSVVEIARRLGIPVPGLSALYGLARVKGAAAGVYAPSGGAL
jgi:2-dehydropantoate 2-reductase